MVSSRLRPHFISVKEPVPILQEAGWAPWPVWTGGKCLPRRESIPDRPASSQSLYRLSYPAHYVVRVTSVKFFLREDNMRFNTPSEDSPCIITYTDDSRKCL